MEYIPGQTLQQRLDEHGPLDVLSALRLGIQIASGLEAAHAQHLIHRDIKPGNILLETGVPDRVKITDFGLARTADDASLTQSGMLAGTPMYMAPEQVMGQRLDQRADLFSFGSVLCQMISGRPPFRGPSTLVTQNVNSPESLALHGRILAGLGRDEEALPLLNQAIEGGSAESADYAARGTILLRQGQIDAAGEDLEKSLNLKPNELAAGALADLLLQAAAANTTWTVLKPAEVISEGGATLTVLDDHSVLASGKNPLGDA